MLPNEIWCEILGKIVDVEDICSCRLVSRNFNEIVKRSEELRGENRKINLFFVRLFPFLKDLYIPMNITQAYNLQHLRKIHLYSPDENLLPFMSTLEDLLFPWSPHYNHTEKIIKISTPEAKYWLTQYKYGRYSANDFNEMDEYLRDVCRATSMISNKKPFQYYLIQEYTYVCPIDELSAFDYYPSSSLIKYSWQPIISEKNRLEIEEYFQYLALLTAAILDLTSSNLKTYEIPILEEQVPFVKSLLPQVEKLLILKPDSLIFSDRVIRFNDLISPEQFIDNSFKF